VTPWIQQLIQQHFKPDIEALLLRSNESQTIHQSISPPDAWKWFNNQLPHEGRHPHWQQLSRFARREYSILPIRYFIHNQPKWVKIQFLGVYWARSLAWDAAPAGVILPLNGPYWESKAKSIHNLRVSTRSITVTTTFLLYDRSAPIWICVYTSFARNLEVAYLWKHWKTSYIYWYATRAKHAYAGRQ